MGVFDQWRWTLTLGFVFGRVAPGPLRNATRGCGGWRKRLPTLRDWRRMLWFSTRMVGGVGLLWEMVGIWSHFDLSCDIDKE